MSRYYQNGSVTGDFNKLMTTLAEALGAKITEAQMRAHAQLFSDVEYEELRAAFGRAARELEFGAVYPSPGKLLTFVRPNADDSALLAWTGFSRAAESIGAWQSLDVDDSAAATALTNVFGSWAKFCELEDGPQLAMMRQEFLAAYRTARRFEPRSAGPVRLLGLCGEPPKGVAAHTWIGRLSIDGAVEKTRVAASLAPARERGRIDA